jgi:hypothetical protein
MGSNRVLVIGGDGYFGRLIVDDLRRYADRHEIVIAGRKRTGTDMSDPASLEAALPGIDVVICAAGPFQRLPVTLAELCLRRGIHYIDIADDRNFVMKVRSVVPANGGGEAPAICSGWSTVSALSGVLARIAASGMARVDSMRIHMAPGNRGARNAATIESLLRSVGREFTVFRDGRWEAVQGWSCPDVFLFPAPVGRRTGYLIDVPDLALFPNLFGARTVEFRVGSEFGFLNRAVSWLGGWSDHAKVFQRAAALFSFLGHDWGAVGVQVTGSSARRVSIVAPTQGPRIAAMPAAVMTNLLLSGARFSGLVSHADWISWEELQAQCEKRGFQLVVEEV